MQRFLIVLGLVLFLVGLAWPLVMRLGLGRLPGDVVIELGSLKLYLPIATSLLLSLLLSALLWLFGR
ncbi:MAG: DUF2905 domain-containing protein [Alphaproteobacteria bacterium]|nr:DUF2905 domain-containing protein [Alphaproteobacteria bacterium]